MIFQLLLELYRPVLFYSPSYTNEKMYLYSYVSNSLVFYMVLWLLGDWYSFHFCSFLLAWREGLSSNGICTGRRGNPIVTQFITVITWLDVGLYSEWLWINYRLLFVCHVIVVVLFIMSSEYCLTKQQGSACQQAFITAYYAIRLLFISYLHISLDSVCHHHSLHWIGYRLISVLLLVEVPPELLVEWVNSRGKHPCSHYLQLPVCNLLSFSSL